MHVMLTPTEMLRFCVYFTMINDFSKSVLIKEDYELYFDDPYNTIEKRGGNNADEN